MRRRVKLSGVYMGLMVGLIYLPILVVMVYSFNESKINSVWAGFSFRWYLELFRDKAILDALRTTLILAALSSLAAAVIGTLGAIGVSKARLRGKEVVEYVATLPIMIPEIILGIALLLFFSLLRLPFGMVTLLIAHTSFCIPYIYLLVKARLVGMDKSLPEAARDLGASQFRVLTDITFPLIAPAVVSGMLLAFAMSIDDVIISVFVTGVNTNTLPIKIYTQLKTGVTPEINALCTLMFAAAALLSLLSVYIGRKPEKIKKTKEDET